MDYKPLWGDPLTGTGVSQGHISVSALNSTQGVREGEAPTAYAGGGGDVSPSNGGVCNG